MKLNKRVKLVKKMVLLLLNDWDTSEIKAKYYGIEMYITLSVRYVFQIIAIFTLPISALLLLYSRKYCEVKNLKSWVITMRTNKGFYTDHYYVELKSHMHSYEESYEAVLNWH